MGAVVLASTAFSWGFIIVKAIALPPAAIATFRLGIGAATLLTVSAVARRPAPVRWGNLLATGIAFGVHQLLFIAATQRTAVAIVTVIAGLQPLVVTAVSRWTVAERSSRALVGWSLLAMLGVALVVGANLDATSRTLTGDLLAIANLLVFSAYFLLAKRSRQDGVDALAVTAWMLPGALLVTGPALVLTGPVMPSEPIAWLLLVVLALVPGNGHLLVNWAHSRISAALASLALALVPVLSGVWARVVFGEPFGPLHMVGMACVVAALYGALREPAPAAV